MAGGGEKQRAKGGDCRGRWARRTQRGGMGGSKGTEAQRTDTLGGWEVGLGWRGEGAAQERPAGSLVDLIPRAWALQLQPHGRARGWL